MSAPPPPKRPGRNSIQVVQALYDMKREIQMNCLSKKEIYYSNVKTINI